MAKGNQRNKPCHCGSGLKYKRCCMEADNQPVRLSSTAVERQARPRRRSSGRFASVVGPMVVGMLAVNQQNNKEQS